MFWRNTCQYHPRNDVVIFSAHVVAVSNCQQHDVPILVAAHLFKPSDNPRAGGVKSIATLELLEAI